MERGAYDGRPVVVEPVASGTELQPGHLTDQLPVAMVPEFRWAEMPLSVSWQPVGVPKYHFTKILRVSLRPGRITILNEDRANRGLRREGSEFVDHPVILR